jgi:hypothetical protein
MAVSKAIATTVACSLVAVDEAVVGDDPVEQGRRLFGLCAVDELAECRLKGTSAS